MPILIARCDMIIHEVLFCGHCGVELTRRTRPEKAGDYHSCITVDGNPVVYFPGECQECIDANIEHERRYFAMVERREARMLD
jgi:hypothetical protein